MTSPDDPQASVARPTSTLRDGIDPYTYLAEKPSAADTCPHCGGVGRVVSDDTLRFVCTLCGGPRFGALTHGLVPPEPADRALRDAEKARRARGGWRGAAATSGVAVGILVLTVAVFALFGALGAAAIVGLVFLLPFAIALMLSTSRARAADARIEPALDAAWGALAAGAARAGASSPDQLARALGVGASQAEQLHTVIAVDAELGGVTDAGSDAPRVRIGGEAVEEAPRSVLAPDPRFDALEKRARAAEAEAAATEAESAGGLGRARTIIASPGDDGSPR